MKNIFGVPTESLTIGSEVLTFDIKGVFEGRKVLMRQDQLLTGHIDPKLQGKTLKDEDFFQSIGKLSLTSSQSDRIIQQIETDTRLFTKAQLNDYSMLVFIVNVPYRSYRSLRRTKHSAILPIDLRRIIPNSLDLIMSEETTADGKKYIVLEEKGAEVKTIFRITNKDDVRLLQEIDDTVDIAQLSAENAQQILMRHKETMRDRRFTLNRNIKHLEQFANNVSKLKQSHDDTEIRAKEIFDEDSFSSDQSKENFQGKVINFPSMEQRDNLKGYDVIGKNTRERVIERASNDNDDNKSILSRVSESNLVMIMAEETKRSDDGDLSRSVSRILLPNPSANIQERSAEDFYDLDTEEKLPLHDVIEQLVFDEKKGGLYKRIIRFGIIDYLKKYSFSSGINRIFTGPLNFVQTPEEYARKFLKCMKKIYQ